MIKKRIKDVTRVQLDDLFASPMKTLGFLLRKLERKYKILYTGFQSKPTILKYSYQNTFNCGKSCMFLLNI
jgi:hypothetical protein